MAPNLAKRLGVEVAVAQGLMNRLEKEGFIKSSGRNRKYVLIVSLKKIWYEPITIQLVITCCF